MVISRFLVASACLSLWCASATAQTETWQRDIELGQKARRAQNLDEAGKHFKAAVQEARSAQGNELELAESLDGLAAVYRDQNKYARSEALYKQSLSIKERILGPWHLSVAETLDNLAGLLSSRRKHDQAEPLYKRAHQIREQALVEHPDVYVEGVPKPVAPPK